MRKVAAWVGIGGLGVAVLLLVSGCFLLGGVGPCPPVAPPSPPLGVYSFGLNDYGELGHGDTERRLVPTRIVGLPDGAVAATGGGHHSLVLLADGDVYSFGLNGAGQLGHGDTEHRSVPTRIAGLPGPAVAVAAGGFHSLVVLANGDVYSFGVNWGGHLGHGDTVDRPVPTRIAGLPGPAVAVAAGAFHSLVVLANGDVHSFGVNWLGQLGHGDQVDRLTPTRIASLPSPADAVAAGMFHSLVLLTNGDVYSFGVNWRGQLGHGDDVQRPTPTKIAGLPGSVVAVAAGRDHSLVLLANGDAYSFGGNMYGRLGHGDDEDRLVPTRIAGLPGPAVAVAAGGFHSLVVLANGDVYSFGGNWFGQLGHGDTTDRWAPTRIGGLPGAAVTVAAGENHSLVLAP